MKVDDKVDGLHSFIVELFESNKSIPINKTLALIKLQKSLEEYLNEVD